MTTLRAFDALAPLWRDVMAEGAVTSPFLSHDWFACCWRTAGPHRGREVWVLEDDAGPLSLVPLVRWKGTVRRLPVRMLGFLDAPDTPFADMIVARGRDEALSTFLAALRERRDWDVVTLRKLRGDSPTLKTLKSLLPGAFPWRIAATETSPYVALSGTWDEFLHDKSQRFRKTCRNIENRVHGGGAVTVEEHREIDPAGPVFAEVMDVSAQSWKGPAGLAMATMHGMPRFFRELTHRASANGWLRLWILRVDGRAVATEYQLGQNGSVHALRADYDASVRGLSPGAYLNQHIVRSLFDRRSVHEYDMGPGASDYKLRWATDAYDTATVEIYAPTAYGRFLHAIETRLVPRARAWRERLGRRCD